MLKRCQGILKEFQHEMMAVGKFKSIANYPEHLIWSILPPSLHPPSALLPPSQVPVMRPCRCEID